MKLLAWLKFMFYHTYKNKSCDVHEENNIVKSMANAKALYKILIIKAHPDRNPNNEEEAKALTEEINKNRYNYNELLKLKDKVESIL